MQREKVSKAEQRNNNISHQIIDDQK